MATSMVLSRRAAIRILAPIALVVMLVLQSQSASAGIGWCRTDPLITVNGHSGHVYVESTTEMLASATGPTYVEVYVPVGSVVSAVPLDNGFGYGYVITFVEDPDLSIRKNHSEVRVSVFVPASDSSLPVKVRYHSNSPKNSDTVKDGTANNEIVTKIAKI